MTGEKNRYKTHEQLWKLEDGDLSTPQHDELVLQLLYKENAFKLYSLIFGESLDDLELSIKSESPICANNSFIIGYIDVMIYPPPTITPFGAVYTPEKDLCIEVKPKIKSFGETLRQIRTYMTFMGRQRRFIIYSPDTRFKTAFETQEIQLVTPSDLGLK